jgi:Protein of unknown function (DUF3237)
MSQLTQDEAKALVQGQAIPGLGFHHVWNAVVEIGPREAMGTSPLGERFIIPITGGVFWGAAGFDALRGKVCAGGADRQLWRADGVRELQAIYEMQTDDGAMLSIHNRVLIDDPANGTGRSGERYALSSIQVTAPQGSHDWLNRRIFVGTLQPLMPARQAVLIRGFMVA